MTRCWTSARRAKCSATHPPSAGASCFEPGPVDVVTLTPPTGNGSRSLHSSRIARQVILVDADRLRADFEALAAIGGTGDGGVRRTSFSDAHLEARAWFLARAQAAGLEPGIDAAG